MKFIFYCKDCDKLTTLETDETKPDAPHCRYCLKPMKQKRIKHNAT